MWCISAVSRAAVSFSAVISSIVALKQPFQKGNSCSCDRYHAPAAPQRHVRRGGLSLAVEVVDPALPPDDHVGLRIAGPDPDLLAVRVDGSGRDDDGGEHQDADHRVGLVADAVGARRALLEEDDVPRLEPVGALGMAQGGVPLQHQQPLLLPHLVVVGTDRLAGRQLVDGGTGFLGAAQQLAEAGLSAAEALRILLVVRELRRRDVDPLHAPKLAAQTAPFGTAAPAEARANVRFRCSRTTHSSTATTSGTRSRSSRDGAPKRRWWSSAARAPTSSTPRAGATWTGRRRFGATSTATGTRRSTGRCASSSTEWLTRRCSASPIPARPSWRRGWSRSSPGTSPASSTRTPARPRPRSR